MKGDNGWTIGILMRDINYYIFLTHPPYERPLKINCPFILFLFYYYYACDN